MDEKHPIKFTHGQFIVVLSTQIVVLVLVFLLGARFGANVFPSFYASYLAPRPYQGLDPRAAAANAEDPRAKVNRLVDTPAYLEEKLEEGYEREHERDREEDSPDSVPHYQVAADGSTYLVDPPADSMDELEDEQDSADRPQTRPQINKSLAPRPGDTHTMVRVKSSGNTRFAIKVSDYYDELMASKKIEALKRKGMEAYMVIEQSRGKDARYVVRIGSFADRQEAEKYATQMSNREDMELQVVRVD